MMLAVKELAAKLDEWPNTTVLPMIHVDIHRRVNLLPERFTAIVEGVIDLVERGYNVNFVKLTATEQALRNYGYHKRLQRLADEHKNFLFLTLE